MNVPAELKYTETHEWIRVEGDTATVGITDHAQNELSDVVYVELPKVGATFSAKAPAAVVESVKAASDIYAPLSGSIIEVNEALTADPAKVNGDAYGSWLFKLKISNPGEVASLKDAAAYQSQIGS
jgi:glycine cleavage system H protein